MKTIPKNEAAPRPSAAILPWFSLLSLAVVVPLLADDAAPPKDHALFAGATLQVEEAPGYSELVGARGSSVLLLSDGKLLSIRRDEVHNVRIERSMKLTDVIARIDGMAVTPTYVPTKQDMDAMRMQVLLNDMASDAGDSVGSSTSKYEAAVGAANAVMPGGSPVAAPPSQTALNSSLSNYSSVQSSVGSFLPGGAADSNSTENNALDIACELSTPRVTHNTYALLLTEYREVSGGKSRYNVDVEPVGDLGPSPRKVAFTQTGFPSQFIPGHVNLHLYSGGLELATNLSESRIDLTADDALRYLVISYVASHAKDSLPAAPLSIAVPANFKQQAAPADLKRTLYLTIGEDGQVKELSAEPDHLVAVSPYIDSTVRKFRYEPALKGGTPVASVVEMRLASLFP